MLRDRSKEERFEVIYNKYQHEVYRISLYYTKDEYEAQDITQKVFYKVYEHFDEINLESVKAYMFRAARNLSYNWLRDRKRELEGDTERTLPNDSLFLPGPEEYYLRYESLREEGAFFSAIMLQLQQENEMWYDILNYIYCLEMSHDDAARMLGISKSVLYSKLYRAKQWIHKRYKEEYDKLNR